MHYYCKYKSKNIDLRGNTIGKN